MSYLLTSATDVKDLLGEIRDFAVLDGWTAAYDDVLVNGKLGLSKGVCKIAMQTGVTTRTNAITSVVLDDAYIRMALAESFAGGVTTYYGHTGSIVTTNGDVNGVETIDLFGPMSNVWLFSNTAKTHIHVVVQSSASRFSYISFGILEDHGLNQPDVAYVAGHYYYWWPSSSDYTANNNSHFNYPASADHRVGFLGHPGEVGSRNINIRIPDTLLDPALGFTDGTFMTRTTILPVHSRGDDAGDAYAATTGYWADFFMTIYNDVTTGGVPLTTIPLFYDEGVVGHTYLGAYPDVRLVSINNLVAAQEIDYGAETWLAFPIKQKGEREETTFGSNPQPVCNSVNYGLAFKKTV